MTWGRMISYLGELKVGMGATGGKSGIKAHVEKTKEFINNAKDLCSSAG